MTIAGVSVFENNEATGLGGAVYNDGKLNMGGAVFSGNKAGGKLNDVYNAGELNFTGDVTLDGGIAGNGTTTFAKDTVLTVKTGTTTISNDVVNKGATLSLVFANGYAGGEYDLITEEGSLDKEFNIAQNALYNIIILRPTKTALIRSAKKQPATLSLRPVQTSTRPIPSAPLPAAKPAAHVLTRWQNVSVA